MSAYALSPAFGTLSDDSDRRFRRLLMLLALPALVLGVIVPLVDLPSLVKQVITPQRYAKLIQQLPVEDKKPEEKKPEPKVEKPQLTPEQKVEKARERARKSLRALDTLADLRDVSMPTISAPLQGNVITSTASTNTFAATAASTSGGIGEIGIVDRGASTTGLGDRSTTAVRSNIAGGKTGGGVKLRRSEEEIQLVFDRNKGALYTIYLRELRQSPDAHGKLVVRLTIAPSGTVKSCTVVASDFANPEFGRKIVARIMLMDFGAKDVGDFTMDYPVTFFPQN
ncbi:MAG: AgmX/PglI C-terminal domain-containing protein [Nevskiaceae bacterium]